MTTAFIFVPVVLHFFLHKFISLFSPLLHTVLDPVPVKSFLQVPNLVKGMQYQFRVCAENRYGVSEPLLSQMVVAKHQFRPPGPPGKPMVYNVTNDGMTIQWEKPLYDGGTPIQGYHVEKRESNSIMWQKVGPGGSEEGLEESEEGFVGLNQV